MKKLLLFSAFAVAVSAAAQTLTVDADKVLCNVEPLIYGAGAEDVNHEIYGGLYDQKIFGEGFEEPAKVSIKGFKPYDSDWSLVSGMAQLVTAQHGKLIYTSRQISSGTVEVEVRMDNINAIAGFILNVTNAANGADAFNGYEVALNAQKGVLVLGKHQQNWQPVAETATAFNPLGEWNKIRVAISGAKLDIYLNGKLIRKYEDTSSPLKSGYIGLRSYGGSATFRNLKINDEDIAFESDSPNVSAMWTALGEGSFEHDSSSPFTGKYAQKISGKEGTGIFNMGLNRWGIGIRKDEPLYLSVYLKGTAQKVQVVLQSADGSREYARTEINGIGGLWKRFDVPLTPNDTDPSGRFCLLLGEEGTVWADQVLLHTDSYPFRSDLTQAFREENLTFLRYGGTMVNAREYMTKDMIGSRLERQPYYGHWYLYSTNGFAIPEFVEFARLIGTEPTFAINIEDNPADVLALLHEIEPYNLKFIEIGNEENLNSSARRDYEHYVERYLILYDAIHKAYPDLQFINAAWWRPDQLETMQYVFSRLDGKCDYWDYHPWTETPQQAKNIEKEIAQMKALFLQWNPQTTMRCAILEENGNTHNMARALAHAVMLNVVRRAAGFVPLDSPANALQPYKQNDNGWDQGQIFFSPSQVWMQPPFYAQQMAAGNHQPLLVESSCSNNNQLDYTATRNLSGDTIVLHIVNYATAQKSLTLNLQGTGTVNSIKSYSLSGISTGENTPERPTRFVPTEASVEPGAKLTLKSYSYTVFVIAVSKGQDAGKGEIRQVPFTDVQVKDQFWKQRLDVMRNTTIRYAFQKCTDAGQLRNFEYAGKIVSGQNKVGDLKFQSGNPYDDAEVYKVLEGASYVLLTQKDQELEAYCDGVVDLICSAQEPDGYLQTNFTIHNPLHPWYGGEKWKMDWNLSHETFNVGELIEAGIAYYMATGKDKLLNCARKAADNMLSVFNENGIRMAPGHAVVEMALVRLYELTREERYLQGCKFFLDCRGIRKFDPTSSDQRVNGKYWQDHLPAIQQRSAEGHAVRALYFYSGMADWVRYSGDQDYETAVTAIWDNIAGKKFYITGGFGARDNNEAFGEDYELPNASAYCETCASVAGSMFNLRMFRLHGQSKYIDMLERALYNTVLDGYGIAGKTFYYPNRLASSSRGDARSEWFGTSCCPTNLCRLIPSVPGYIYATDDESLYWNLFVASTAKATVGNTTLHFTVTGSYPYKGEMKLTIDSILNSKLSTFGSLPSPRRGVGGKALNSQLSLRVRIPGWAVNKPVESDLYSYVNPTKTQVIIKLNGEEVTYSVQNGYAVIKNDWKEGDEVDVILPMDVHQVVSNENLKSNKGLCAYEYGPLVYCAEGIDNGGKLDNLYIETGATFTTASANQPLSTLFKGGILQLSLNGKKANLIPYFARAHRAASPMMVWIPSDSTATQQPVKYIDEVITCNESSEKAHNLQGTNMRTGTDLGWRDSDGGWISYDMKTDPERPMDFITRQWGSDAGNRRYNIYCNGTLFAYDEVNNFAPGEYYLMRHPIPFELTKGKEKVTIKMQAVSANDIVGGLYGAFTALSQDVPEGTVAVDNMWTTRPASRTSHQYSSNGESGTFRARTWLDGSGEAGQSWTMKVNKTNRNYLMLLYWGDESDTRNFNIMCDDVLVAQESLLHNDPGRFMMRCYPIPEEGTSGKETVRIHLTSPTGTKTGGIFYAYMLSAKDDETSIIAPSAFHQNDSIYDLSGRKVANSPISYSLPKEGLSGALRKGLYVHNGIKIAIK